MLLNKVAANYLVIFCDNVLVIGAPLRKDMALIFTCWHEM
jgi:hypothetical protein